MRRDGNGVLLKCQAGCETADVLAAVELTMADLFDDAGLRDAWSPRRDYVYPGGRRVHRKPNKEFPQSGNKGDRSLFGGDRIGDAQVVYVVEGEKDVEVIQALGRSAVCSAMGAGKAELADWSALRGRKVTVVTDRDEPGRVHAAQVAQVLRGVAASVRIVEAKEGKDVADHVAAGYALDELVEPAREGMPTLWRAIDLKRATQPRWLASSRLPYAAVSLLVGEEGIGKSLLWVLIIAYVTTGKALPSFGLPAREPSPVILVITEDDWRDTVLPRLQVAGVDMSMVYVICTDDDGSGSPVFPRDMHLIVDAHPAPALVVVDAWLDTVPTNLSVRDPQQARQALHPWKEAATKTGAAILLLCHTNRVATPNARDRYGATGELRKKARMTLYAQTDEEGNLIVGPEKANGARTVVASKFAVKAVGHFAPTEDHDGTVPLLTYLGESDQTAREHLAEGYAAAHGPDAETDALTWLAKEIAGGARWASDIQTAAELAGISDYKLRRAKLQLRAESAKDGDTGAWYWTLPGQGGGKPPCPSGSTPSTPSTSCPAGKNQYVASTSKDGKTLNSESQQGLNGTPPCEQCGKFGARPDTGLCQWCTAAKNRGGR